MNFELSPEQKSIQELVRSFAEKELQKDILVRDASGEFPRDLYDQMGKMGLIGLPYPN